MIYWTSLVPDVYWVDSRDGYWGIFVHIVKVSSMCCPTERCKNTLVNLIGTKSHLLGNALILIDVVIIPMAYDDWHFLTIPTYHVVHVSCMISVSRVTYGARTGWRGAPSSQIRTGDVCLMKSFGLQLFISYNGPSVSDRSHRLNHMFSWVDNYGGVDQQNEEASLSAACNWSEFCKYIIYQIFNYTRSL